MKKNRTPIAFRIDADVRDKLDRLCGINSRSQREIIEILIKKAFEEYEYDKSFRIDP